MSFDAWRGAVLGALTLISICALVAVWVLVDLADAVDRQTTVLCRMEQGDRTTILGPLPGC